MEKGRWKWRQAGGKITGWEAVWILNWAWGMNRNQSGEEEHVSQIFWFSFWAPGEITRLLLLKVGTAMKPTLAKGRAQKKPCHFPLSSVWEKLGLRRSI